MSWIEEISFEQARGQLKKLYDRIKGPNGYLDNILSVHSLRPHSLFGHMSLYKNVLHNSNNSLPKWYLELIGVYVSQLNQCAYCVQHHFAGLRRLLQKDAWADQLLAATSQDEFGDMLDQKYLLGLAYAKVLTKYPHMVSQVHIESMRSQGLDDGEILEINQVVSYFCYANRTVLGLGVSTEGDILGLSPNESSEPDNWSHS
ncbi:MAG: peroxidase-related enzyme [Bacteroidota bacterium]